ncbi:toxin-antitoxin system YwqK family antitoxin [Flammeovirga kamogawensis]|uniref:YD repeat-containing protein n=1 Tax=Flammeovirga kamogawensis TaxID=373891 RepID=A0ABX8H5Y0_9BACT|nr:hypothetical protein [Flammeovirga kamogawensis]MBB6461832.1 hypothetical protein [Flammeovirga kamogawensis]QWG10747.1 hypothetical protein KM029_25525 [Flammeovirga kamogawensis]TRX63849.1 hypothetical protein EO216_25895 [Flammeovirga kamogawensis]
MKIRILGVLFLSLLLSLSCSKKDDDNVTPTTGDQVNDGSGNDGNVETVSNNFTKSFDQVAMIQLHYNYDIQLVFKATESYQHIKKDDKISSTIVTIPHVNRLQAEGAYTISHVYNGDVIESSKNTTNNTVYTYSYNDEGYISAIKEVGTDTRNYEFTYNEDGKVAQSKRIDNSVETIFKYTYTGENYIAKKEGEDISVIVNYDDEGRIISSSSEGADAGSDNYKFEFSYQENGELEELKITEFTDFPTSGTYGVATTTFDTNGDIKESNEYWHNELTLKEVYQEGILTLKEEYTSGKLAKKEEYVDGKVSMIQEFNDQDVLKLRETYSEGQLTLKEEFHDNTQLSLKEVYVNDKISLKETFDDQGNKTLKEEYTNGDITIKEEYHTNGQVSLRINYADDFIVETKEEFDDTGLTTYKEAYTFSNDYITSKTLYEGTYTIKAIYSTTDWRLEKVEAYTGNATDVLLGYGDPTDASYYTVGQEVRVAVDGIMEYFDTSNTLIYTSQYGYFSTASNGTASETNYTHMMNALPTSVDWMATVREELVR